MFKTTCPYCNNDNIVQLNLNSSQQVSMCNCNHCGRPYSVLCMVTTTSTPYFEELKQSISQHDITTITNTCANYFGEEHKKIRLNSHIEEALYYFAQTNYFTISFSGTKTKHNIIEKRTLLFMLGTDGDTRVCLIIDNPTFVRPRRMCLDEHLIGRTIEDQINHIIKRVLLTWDNSEKL